MFFHSSFNITVGIEKSDDIIYPQFLEFMLQALRQKNRPKLLQGGELTTAK